MKITLDKLKAGESAQVSAILGNDSCCRRRLLAMGFTPGTQVIVNRVAPLGDPMQLQVRGVKLSMRHDEAGTVEVMKI